MKTLRPAIACLALVCAVGAGPLAQRAEAPRFEDYPEADPPERL